MLHVAAAAGHADAFCAKVRDRSLVIGIIGLGYVGIPLALAALDKGFRVVGFDNDPRRVADLNEGRRPIRHLPAEPVSEAITGGRLAITGAFDRLRECDALLIAVPTPLGPGHEPDLSHVAATTEEIGRRLLPGQLVVLESTTYPGTTREVMRPRLEQLSGLACGRDFFLAFSPEREDPGNAHFSTGSIPKVVGGEDEHALAMAEAMYGAIVVRTVPVSSAAAAEAVKLTENIFRAVNIALVNELKVVYQGLGVDIWEVIDAAKTKPFGFMPFYPGPGPGGHCIPVDPYYLTWKAREHALAARLVETAGEINAAMPAVVVDRLASALRRTGGVDLSGARILLLGVAYKKNVDDIRESPALKLFDILEARGAVVDFHDPYIPLIPPTREHPGLAGRASVAFDVDVLRRADAVLVATDHDGPDYRLLGSAARCVVDTRNACARAGVAGPHIFKA